MAFQDTPSLDRQPPAPAVQETPPGAAPRGACAAEPAFPGAHLALAGTKVLLCWLGSACLINTPGKLSLMNPSWEAFLNLIKLFIRIFCRAVGPPCPIPLCAPLVPPSLIAEGDEGLPSCLHPNPPLPLGRHPWVSPGCTPSLPPLRGLSQLSQSLHWQHLQHPTHPSSPSSSGVPSPAPATSASVGHPSWGTAGEPGAGRGALRRLHQLGCVCTAPVTHVEALRFPWDDVRPVLLRQILLR